MLTNSNDKLATWAPGFSSCEQEISNITLPVEGSIPTWLQGTLLRNGPAKFDVGTQELRHWFDGLALLHRFAFEKGQVSYCSKFLKSQAFQDAKNTGKLCSREFATEPSMSGWQRIKQIFLHSLATTLM